MHFSHAPLMANAQWKFRVGGIPHNSFLVAAAFAPDPLACARGMEKEILLLNVLNPGPLPQDGESLKTRVEYQQRKAFIHSGGTESSVHIINN